MTKIVLDQVAKPFHGALYSKLTSREREIVDFLLGIDALELHGNKLVTQ